MSAVAYRARWVFPVISPPIAGGIVTVVDGRIASVGRTTDAGQVIDLGDVALLPGLVNAHTHLEFSDCRQPLGRPGMPLPSWIREVIRHRRATTSNRAEAMAVGYLESVKTGTCLLGEIATAGWAPATFDQQALDATVFYELIGLAPERIEPNLALAREHLSLANRPPSAIENPKSKIENLFSPALSPHAPYSVHPRLVEGLVALAAEAGAPVAMHLAESTEEIELLRAGTGPFVELLTELGAWRPDAIPPGSRPLDYLKRLAAAPRSLVIHGNYLDDEEIAFVAEHRERMSVVYCPRTHAYFGHKRHPLSKLLAAGCRVALGTDSRASNPDLDLLAEIRAVAATFPEISPADALRLGTMEGANTLGFASDFGTIEPGKRANFIQVKIDASTPADPHELLLTTNAARSV